jgi:membrane protein DedA with SNARE-associated domain
LAYAGLKLGERWDSLRVYFHRLDLVLGIVIVAGVIYFVKRHLR